MSRLPRRAPTWSAIGGVLLGALFVAPSATQAAPGLQIFGGDVAVFVPPVLQVGPVDVLLGTGSLYAGGYASPADVRVGDAVAVTCFNPSGSALLAVVVAHSPLGLTDRISGISAPNQSLTVAGRTVAVTGATLLAGGYATFADFRLGDFVATTGSAQVDGSLVASSVTLGTASFTGTVQSVGAGEITAGGISVQVDSGTTFGGGLGSIADVQIGQVLKVTGGTRSDGLFLAGDVTLLGLAAVADGATAFVLDPPKNPLIGGTLRVRFSLPVADRARLELLDVGGRRLASQDVIGVGTHEVALGEGQRLESGVYFIRLIQGPRLASARTVVLN